MRWWTANGAFLQSTTDKKNKGSQSTKSSSQNSHKLSLRTRQVTYGGRMVLWLMETRISRHTSKAKFFKVLSLASYREEQRTVSQVLVIWPGLLCCRQVRSNWWDDRRQLRKRGRDETCGEPTSPTLKETQTHRQGEADMTQRAGKNTCHTRWHEEGECRFLTEAVPDSITKAQLHNVHVTSHIYNRHFIIIHVYMLSFKVKLS